MTKIDISKFKDVQFGSNVEISGEVVTIEPGCTIDDNVKIQAHTIHIGFGSKIEKNVVVKGIATETKLLNIGDYCHIGYANQILVPEFVLGDYGQIHNSCLINGYKFLHIGHNCWIGQQSILNSTEYLKIGNNVRIGTQSQLWTHVASGELLEGCTLFGNKPLILEDDVWLVGGAVISPGLKLAEKTIVMSGSVLTKSTITKHTYAGVPATDITEKLNCWRDISLDEKFRMLRGYVQDFTEKFPEYKNSFIFRETYANELEFSPDQILIFKELGNNYSQLTRKKTSFYDLKTKQYFKTRSKAEIAWMRYCIGYRARFTPYN